MMRERLSSELKAAMKGGDKRRTETIRLINAALKDRDIDARTSGKAVGEAEILALLLKMVKSRQESRDIYVKAGRDDLAHREAEEIAIITDFLPQQLSDAEIAEAVDRTISDLGAIAMSDMGKVIATLRANHAGRMDFGKASAMVKSRLTS